MLKLENVSKIYYNNGIIATGFSKVNLELNLGEFVVITGESGSGKSTLLNVISGLDSYEEGEMYINGQETSHYTEKDLEQYRKKYIANIFQNFNLINSYTVYQNVELVLLLSGYKKSQVKKKILDIIDQVGLTKFKNTKVSKLSGGQKQRVAIARAIIKDSPIIVADEPTGNLDTESAKDVIDILRKVSKDKLVIIVTHNIEQFEEHATRIIKMHDGKIIENREIEKIDETNLIKETKFKKVTFFNKLRLGIRNTFNIKSKFLLLFMVFFFITSALFLEYTSFKLAESNIDNGVSVTFKDLSENRILIKKQDKTSFSEEDYSKISNLQNIDYIVKNDVFLDTQITISRSTTKGYGECWYATTINDVKNFKEQVDLGRIPEQENEAILQTSSKNYYIENFVDEVLEQNFSIKDSQENSILDGIKIVGIKFNENSNNYDSKIYMYSTQIEKLNTYMNEEYSTLKALFQNQYIQNKIVPSEKVEKENAIVSNDLKSLVKNGRIKGKDIQIEVSNIFYSDKINLTINNTYTEKSFTRLTGNDNYKLYGNAIFVNNEVYDSLFNKQPYQSSVFVKDFENIDTTILELNNLGIDTKKVTDFKVITNDNYNQLVQMIRTIVTIILIFILFFISYFIIKIILKSRSIYYTTLRMLGSSRKEVRKILDIELFINSNLAYFTSILIIYLTKINIINIQYLSKLSQFIGLWECVLIYVIIILMSKLISRKVAKNIFQKTAISTYNEEV